MYIAFQIHILSDVKMHVVLKNRTKVYYKNVFGIIIKKNCLI